MTEHARKVYVKDIPAWEAKGWQPTRNADGEIVVHPSMTGPQTWVVRTQPALPGMDVLSGAVDWID